MVKDITNFFRGIFTKADLSGYAIINHENLTIEISAYSPNINAYSEFTQTKLAILKNLNFAKWDYEVPKNFDTERLEQFLFFNGKACIYKAESKNKDSEYIISDFTIKKKTVNNRPTHVTIRKRNQNSLKLEVDKDCVLIYTDSSFLFGKTFLGPCWRVFNLLQVLERTWTEIIKSIMLSNNKITVPVGTKPEIRKKLAQQILSVDPVIELQLELGLGRGKNNEIDNLLLRPDDRLEILISAYRFIWNMILEQFGIRQNSQQKKERLVSEEARKDNEIPDGINNAELKMRQKSLESMEKVFGEIFRVELRQVNEKEQELENEKMEGGLNGKRN